ncbi:cytochrome P450 6d1-like [Musca vetustissima]|uniref:cytochrome P450 6d1-like n=1 Tax=Musca vetustissima TaxID=27455 RepID=UPI002AB7C293|nr:cytochrome P450 6d1-like [Musca vetustissima]
MFDRYNPSTVFYSIAQFLALFGTLDPITADLREIVRRTIEYREKHGVARKDILQLLLQLRNSGEVREDDDTTTWQVDAVAENQKTMSIDTITANLFLFYIAGSETTSSTIAYTLYELAMYPEILQRVQAEVLRCLERNNLKRWDNLSYDILQEMPYLDLCIMETTRKYPGLPIWNRECTKDYRLSHNDFVIKKGTAIIIPIMGIGRDAKYFPQPMDYKPERYAEEKDRNNMTAFMPFGDGPRYCIAKRMGIINVKAALVKILANFNIETQPRKEIEFKFHSTPVLMPKEGLKITLVKKY